MTGLEKRLARATPRFAGPQAMSVLVPSQARARTHAALPRIDRLRRPASSLWIRLLTAHDLIQREVRREFGDAVTLPQFDVLAQLKGAGAGLTPAELSRRLRVTAGNLTGIVARLERQGLVHRRGDPEDGRAFRIRLTTRGRAQVETLMPRHTRLLARLADGLSPEEQNDLMSLLGRLGDGIVTRADPERTRVRPRRAAPGGWEERI